MPIRTALALSLAILLIIQASVHAQCEWRVGPHQAEPGLRANVLAEVVWDPDGAGPLPLLLVAAGNNLTRAGIDPASNIAAYDGSQWKPLGGGISGGEVRALTVFNGELIAAGTFTSAGGQPADRIARYNGTTWSPLGGGLNNTVNALAVFNGDLYAAGLFTTAGGGSANRIARWNGSGWAPLGSGFASANDVPRAMAVYGTSLYIGGTFGSAGGVAASNLAQWNGSGWFAAGNPNGPVNALVARTGTSAANSFLVVGGSFTSVGGIPATNIATYNPLATPQWTALAGGLPNPCTVLAVRNIGLTSYELVAAVGTGTAPPPAQQVWRWNAGAWNSLGTFGVLNSSPLATSLSYYGGRWHIGLYTPFAGPGIAGAVRAWDATDWAPAGAGISGTIHALQNFGSDLIFAGDFAYASNIRVNNIARWNGTAFEAMGGGTGGPVRALTVFEGQLWAAGEFTVAGTVSTNNIARWNGTAWEAVGLSAPAPASGGPRAFAILDGQLVVGGLLDGNIAVRRWTGTTWIPMSNGISLSGFITITALAVHGNILHAGGSSPFIGSGSQQSAIARFDSIQNQWFPIAPGSSSGGSHSVSALHVHDNQLYAAGYNLGRVTFPDTMYHPLAIVYTSFFSSIPEVAQTQNPDRASVLATYNGALYAAGGFDRVNGQPATDFARLDPGGWAVTGNGLRCDFLTGPSAVYQGELVMAGETYSGSVQLSNGWSRWYCAAPCYANCDGSTIAPILNVNDFVCFQTRYAAGNPAANCDGSTILPVLNVNDFICFQSAYAAGCP